MDASRQSHIDASRRAEARPTRMDASRRAEARPTRMDAQCWAEARPARSHASRRADVRGNGRAGMTPYLSLAIWVPIAAGVAVLMLGGERDAMKARWLALVGALAGFLVTIPLYTHFDLTTSAMQFVEKKEWIQYFDINYHLGVDGISVLFIILNAFT